MNIVYISRSNMFEKVGGDTIQLLKTKEYLEKLYGLNIQICLDLNDIKLLESADLVHIFNLQNADYTLEAIKICKKMKKRTLLSTIFWDLRSASYVNFAHKLLKISPNLFLEKTTYLGDIVNKFAYKIFKSKNNIMYNKRKVAKKILKDVDYILPNSNEELSILSDFYNIKKENLLKKCTVIPNAIDYDHLNPDNDKVNESMLLEKKDYILQVGRIEPIKNQLNLLKAMIENKEIPLVFLGRIGDQSYYRKLKKIADKRGNVLFVKEVHNNEIYKYYKNAKCHVLPSFRESPGLVSLEALVSGTPIVVSDKEFCPISYYQFDRYGYICNPFSVRSIKKAVLLAYNEGHKSELPNNYYQDYSYSKVADETYKAYQKLMFRMDEADD